MFNILMIILPFSLTEETPLFYFEEELKFIFKYLLIKIRWKKRGKTMYDSCWQWINYSSICGEEYVVDLGSLLFEKLKIKLF